MKNIAVYCGSSKGKDTTYSTAVRELGKTLVKNNITMVYGAGSVGLMGEIADEMLDSGGKVIGIIPQFLMDLEVGHNGLTKLEIVKDMHIRKARMIELSDGFIAMPGGFGTLDEIFEALTWSQLELHKKPIAFYNVDGYFDKLLAFMNHMVHEGFLKEAYVKNLIVSSNPSELIQEMRQSATVVNNGKWI